jgi:hypothetical protein
VITATGVLNGSLRRIRAEVTRLPLTVQAVAAIASDYGVDLTGSCTVCGHNHDINTPVGTQIPGCDAWELCTNRTLCASNGCLLAVQTTGDEAQTGGSADLEGYPTWADTSSTNTFYDVHEYLGLSVAEWNEIKSNPDYTSSNDATHLEGIVIINHDATAGEKFTTNDGNGLIYVNGDMHVSGNLEWKGFIYVEGTAKITGSAWVLGGMAVRGTITDTFGTGNSTILYSQQAITTYVGRSLPLTTLAWTER